MKDCMRNMGTDQDQLNLNVVNKGYIFGVPHIPLVRIGTKAGMKMFAQFSS